MISVSQLKHTLKHHQHPIVKKFVACLRYLIQINLPAPSWFFKPILLLHLSISSSIKAFIIRCYWTPLAKQVFVKPPKQLHYDYFGLPFIAGSVAITIGENCHLLKVDFMGRSASAQLPEIHIGDRVVIAYNVSILSGSNIIIEDDVMIAGAVRLNGYAGHPLNAQARLAKHADTDEQSKAIHLKKNVWLATGVTVSNGVTIGENTVVAAGSIVTKDLPANVLAAGVPAKVIRELP